MKRIFTIIIAGLISASAYAQAPEKMSYQAVVRDGSNNLVTSSAVGMQVSILQGSPSGTAAYVETQTPTTNANGLVSIEIGGGSLVSGDFATIDWANGPYFVKTETDPAGGTSYTITGTSQLLSVPFALHAKNSDSWQIIGDTTYTTNRVSIGSSNGNAPFSIYGLSGVQQKFNRSVSNMGVGVGLDFNLLNTSNDYFRYGAIYGGIEDNNSGTELGFLSFHVANGDGVADNFFFEQVIKATTEKITIKDVLNIEPRASAPSAPTKGDIYMDDITNKLMVFDGAVWQACW